MSNRKDAALVYIDKLMNQVRNSERTWRGGVHVDPASMIDSLAYLRRLVREIRDER